MNHEKFRETKAYLLHPSNSPRNANRDTEIDEFRQRQRERMRQVLIEDCARELSEIHDLLRASDD